MIFLGSGGGLDAQFDANLGRIVGTVTGPDGAALPGATVSVSFRDSGVVRAVRADEAGRYQIGSLQPGLFSVSAESHDFAPSTADGVTVSVGSAVRVDLELALEPTRVTVNVSASMLDAMLPASSSVVASKSFNALPINGRRFHDFALLTPAVQISPATGHLSFAAMRGIYSNVAVDGANYNQAFFGGIQGGERAGHVITVPQSAVQEFQAITAGFTAEFGQTISGVVNVSTKSGGSELRGDAFYQIRHPRLGVLDPFGDKVLEKLQQFGGAAGGPVVPGRAFWFLAVERQASISPRYVEFPALDLADRDRGPEAYDHFRSLEGDFESTNDAWAAAPRFDWNLGGGGRFMARYNVSSADARNGTSSAVGNQARTTTALSSNGTERSSIHFLTMQLTSLLGPRVVNQLRSTVTHESRPRIANSASPAVYTTLGRFGTAIDLPTTESDIRPVLSNSTMVHAGAHDVKVGGMIDRVWIDDQFGYAQYGYFQPFSSDPSELLDILAPGGQIPNRFDAPGIFLRQIGNTLNAFQVGHAALYLQDSWRIARGLTIDAGLRWAGQFNQPPETGNEVLAARVRAPSYAAGRVDPAYIPSDLAQWMPRVGFAYSPGATARRLVVRGSLGIFHAVTPPVLTNGAGTSVREPAFNVTVALPTSAPTVYRQFLAHGIDLNQHSLADLPLITREQTTAVLGGDPNLGASPYVMSPKFRNPRSVKLTLALEYEILHRAVAGVQWMRHRSSRLQGLRDYNLPPSQVRPGDQARIPYFDTSARPAPQVGPLRVIESIGRAEYDGVALSWKYLGRRLQIVTHYTYARAYSSDINETWFWDPVYTDNMRPQDAFGPSSLDMRHQLTGHATLGLPAGFSAAAILRATSAPPMDAAAGTDLNGDQLDRDRALQAPGRYFGRNSFRNRAMRNIDLRLLREFDLGERFRVEFSIELFNALNFENVEYAGFNAVYGPGVDLDNGAVTGPAATFRRLRNEAGALDRSNRQIPGVGPLQAQLGLRLYF